MKLKIVVLHYYQDPQNPKEQEIIISADYATMYALFKSLLDSHLDFIVEMKKEEPNVA